jgi:hypothetical protein
MTLSFYSVSVDKNIEKMMILRKATLQYFLISVSLTNLWFQIANCKLAAQEERVPWFSHDHDNRDHLHSARRKRSLADILDGWIGGIRLTGLRIAYYPTQWWTNLFGDKHLVRELKKN